MSEFEIYRPQEFSKDAALKADSHSPHVVVRQTGENLKLFMHDQKLNRQLLHDYVESRTFPYLERAKEAIPMFKALAHEMTVSDYPTVMQFIKKEGAPEDMEDQIEALAYTAVVFQEIPRRYRSRLFPHGFKRNGVYGPPSTISGYVRRIDELKRVTGEILDGKVKITSLPTYRTSLLRTEAFFAVGAELPPPTDSEKGKVEIAHDNINKLLEGIEVDL